jgi:hypothetical protein
VVDEERHWYAEGMDAEELAFQRLYGPVLPSTPADCAELMRGFEQPWWIAGGWSIEAFTGVPRPHEDVDLAIFRRDVAAFREQLKDRYHLWSNAGGTLRPMTDARPDPIEDGDQIWLREHALAPWRYDVVLNPDRDGRWVFRRDPSFDYALDEITWVAPDGIRYIAPEVALAYKAKLSRPKDEVDLATTLPMLDDRRRTWLRDMVAHLHPGHHWLDRL